MRFRPEGGRATSKKLFVANDLLILSGDALGMNIGTSAPSHNSAAIEAAKQALARANATVDADRRAHSPDCVACDQKLVDAAANALAQAKSVSSINGFPVSV